MRRILTALAVIFAIAALARTASAERRARLGERLETAIEHCPPVVLLRRLETQNAEVIALLREQNQLLRARPPAGQAA